MKKMVHFKLAGLILLSLIGLLPVMAHAVNPIEIKSMEQLQSILSSPQLRSSEVTDLKIVEDGIFVDKLVQVGIGSFRLYGGPLIRDDGYKGVILFVKEGGRIVIENTIDGGNINTENRELIEIQNGGTLSLEKGGVLQKNKGIEHALCISNFGTFNLNGGTITNNTGSSNHVILNMGTANLNTGEIINNESLGSIYSASTGHTFLNSSGVTLTMADATLFVEDGSPINLTSSLRYKITVETIMNKGGVVAVGSGNYRLTESDLTKIFLKNTQHQGLNLKLENNQIVLSEPSSGTGEITTQKELQDAIDKAAGTVNNPTTIQIKGEIKLTKAIEVRNKYVLLTGGTISNAITTDPRTMFYIYSGQLIFQNITIDGGCRPTGYHMACLVNLQGGTLIMNDGAMLTGAGLTSDISAIWIFKGDFIMNGGQIFNNYFYGDLSMASVVSIYDGSFTMNGGQIFDNVGDNFKIVGLFGYSSKVSFMFNGGLIYKNDGGYLPLVAGDFIIDKNSLNQIISNAIEVGEKSVVYFKQKLLFTLTVRFSANWNMPDNFVLARGYAGYQITEDDIKKIKLPSGYILILSNNTLIIKKSGNNGEITDVDGLQAAIDAAPVGSADKPTAITVSQLGVDFTKSIVIKDKHIKITANGGSFRNATTKDICFFDVKSGSLILDYLSLLGAMDRTTTRCCFVKVASGATLNMNKISMEKARSDYEWSMLRISGKCTLKECQIKNSVGGVLIYILSSGNCVIEGGSIMNNTCSDTKTVSSLIYNLGDLDYVSGVYTNNHAISLQSNGNATLRSVEMKNYLSELIKDEGSSIITYRILNIYDSSKIGDDIFLSKDKNGKGCIQIFGSVKKSIHVVIHEPEEGWIVVKGVNYTITKSDLQKFALGSSSAKGWTLVLSSDNTIVLQKEGTSSEIDTQEKLQAAIEASNGTVNAPGTITIAKEILIYRSILIKNKYVKLTGGTLKNAASADLRMFDVSSGYLGLTNITLDGNKKNATGYCTLIEMNGGSCDILEGTKLTNALARGGSDAVVTVARGTLAFKDGSISGNTSDGGDIIWVSGSGNFFMTGGSITGNNNSGRYIMASIEMTYGVMNLSGGSISDNSGNRYGLYVTKPFTLGGNANIEEVIILNRESRILVSSALQNKVTIGFMNTNMSSGTIVASGTGNYKLTEADAKKFVYRYANTYSFSLSENNIVLINLDAANKTFNIKTESYKDGILSVDKVTAKENELVTVTVKPASGKKLYTEMLRYNEVNKLTSTKKENVYTFKMPPANVIISAAFVPELINVLPLDPTPFDPDKDPVPDTGISDLDSLIFILGDKKLPIDIKPKAKPILYDSLPNPIRGAVSEAGGKGDDVIGSLDELISIVSKDANGVILTTKVLYSLPRKISLRIYLPNRLIVSEQLRASGTSNYYILNECEGNVTRIAPTYDPNSNSLTFSTDKLGTFVVMNKNTFTANESITNDDVKISVVDGNILINGLQPGMHYGIYDFSGRLLKSGVYKGEVVSYRPEISGSYIIDYISGSQKVYFSK